MLFVSVSPELEILIRPDVPGTVVNEYGQTVQTSLRPALYARFKPKALDAGQRARADTEFRRLNPEHPYGATPYRDGSVMGSQFADFIDDDEPEPYRGYDPIHQLGKFDTLVDIDYTGQPEALSPEGSAELRRLVESKLLADTSLNGPQGFILLDNVVIEKPWPAYPTEGQGRHERIEKHVREGGYDPNLVIAFESSQEKPGEGVIKRMEALLEEQKAVDAENAALGAEIPA